MEERGTNRIDVEMGVRPELEDEVGSAREGRTQDELVNIGRARRDKRRKR